MKMQTVRILKDLTNVVVIMDTEVMVSTALKLSTKLATRLNATTTRLVLVLGTTLDVVVTMVSTREITCARKSNLDMKSILE
jgi:hypothetical protein